MLKFKPFFHHYQAKTGGGKLPKPFKARGFTVYVTPSDQERQVNVQITFCTDKHFCKKIGCELVMQQEVHTINARDLPMFIGKAMDHVCGCVGDDDTTYENWILKYLL